MEELTPLLADERGLRRDALHEQVQLAFRNLAPVGSEDAPSPSVIQSFVALGDGAPLQTWTCTGSPSSFDQK